MEVVIYTKDGMVKKINLNDLTVSKYNKLYTYIKLKDNDLVVDVQRAKENTMIVSKSGYYISYKTDEIPIVSSGKSAGVKGINLKDDEVVSGLTYDSDDEYLNIFTNQKTGKRIKLSDLTESSRAKRGSMVIKPVKSTNYEIVSALITETKDIIGLEKLEDTEELKNTDISIMDLASTGSNITKSRYTKAYVVATLKKVDEVAKEDKVKEVKKTKAEVKQEELEFLDEFKI